MSYSRLAGHRELGDSDSPGNMFVFQESVTNSVDECLTENPLTLRPAKRPAQLDSPSANLDGLPMPLVPQVSLEAAW